ncbi:hypothetical protein VUR80DRAFT_2227 [Thermomyces stellatus]
MAIKLGLQRMQALYGQSPQTWKAIHVAGTNGKGSVCSYISALLARANISHGRFTSPFIRRPEDSILINNKPISSSLFRSLYYAAGKEPAADKPTHFERMTYAAFAAFDHFNVKYGVVETGLGGRLDSTNVLRNKAVTAITSIGLDHQEYLGDTIEQIAAEKGGIINGAPCVIGQQADPAVVPVLLDLSHRAGSKTIQTTSDPGVLAEASAPGLPLWPRHVLENARIAIKACEQLDEFKDSKLSIQELLALPEAHMEGRLQEVDISHTPPGTRWKRSAPIIVDGAHNYDAIRALRNFTTMKLRVSEDGRLRPLTWVVGMSSPRDASARKCLEALFHGKDKVVFTEYKRPTGDTADMTEDDYFLSFRPEPLSAKKLYNEMSGAAELYLESRASLDEAIERACELARADKTVGESPIVVTGSLYLVSDVLRWVDSYKRPKGESAGDSA